MADARRKPKAKFQICDCGNKASVWKWREWVCERCDRIEREMIAGENYVEHRWLATNPDGKRYMMSSAKFKDETLRQIVFINERLRELTSAVTNKFWKRAADEGGQAVFRLGQLVKSLDTRAKEEKQ